ncbi:hypothetical protein CsSME_00051713 [Camellia sinensis var. sinensis]
MIRVSKLGTSVGHISHTLAHVITGGHRYYTGNRIVHVTQEIAQALGKEGTNDQHRGGSSKSHMMFTSMTEVTLLKTMMKQQLFLIDDGLNQRGRIKKEITGVFNKNCMITYAAYRNIFPIWALGEYRCRFPFSDFTAESFGIYQFEASWRYLDQQSSWLRGRFDRRSSFLKLVVGSTIVVVSKLGLTNFGGRSERCGVGYQFVSG